MHLNKMKKKLSLKRFSTEQLTKSKKMQKTDSEGNQGII